MKLDIGLSVESNQLLDAARIAREADELGFACLWTNETKHDSFLPLVLVAEHSRRLQLGTSVAIAFGRSPMVIAQTAWDLQAFSGGRLLLGLGTQVKAHIERRFGATWDTPVPRLREYLAALHAIWTTFQTGAPLRFEGAYYRHTLMTPFFNPGPIKHPAIPIFIAGVNTGLARLTGEVAQGFHVHPLHSRRYVEQVIRPAIAEGASRAGRSPNAVELAAAVFAVTGTDAAQTEQISEQVRRQIAFYASTPTYRPVFETHGWGEVADRLALLARSQQWREMPGLITDEMLATFAVVAAPDELGAALRERYSGVLDRVSLYLPFIPGERDEFWRATARAIRRG